MEGKGTPITEEYVNTLLIAGALGFIGGIIWPFGLVMLIGVNATITDRIIGASILTFTGFLFYLAYRVGKKYEEQKRRKQGGDIGCFYG